MLCGYHVCCCWRNETYECAGAVASSLVHYCKCFYALNKMYLASFNLKSIYGFQGNHSNLSLTLCTTVCSVPTLTEKLVFLTISWYLEDNTHQKTLKSQDGLAFTVNSTLKHYSERDYTSRYPDGESSCGLSVTLSGSFIMESDFNMTSETGRGRTGFSVMSLDAEK